MASTFCERCGDQFEISDLDILLNQKDWLCNKCKDIVDKKEGIKNEIS